MEDLKPLSPDFFAGDTLSIARQLLGCHLMRWWPETHQWVRCKIVETEAYTADDPACHAYNRKTGRAEMLYRPPGTAYVYLIYGMYDCLNVVTEPHGTAGAVLFRALEPPVGSGFRTNGPGRLTKSLHIKRAEFNDKSLTDPQTGLYLAAGDAVPDTEVIQTTRIGITKAVDFPWRFYIKDNLWVSAK